MDMRCVILPLEMKNIPTIKLKITFETSTPTIIRAVLWTLEIYSLNLFVSCVEKLD